MRRRATAAVSGSMSTPVDAGEDAPDRLLCRVDGAAGDRWPTTNLPGGDAAGGVPLPEVVHRADEEVSGAAGRVDQPQRPVVAEGVGGPDQGPVEDEVDDEVRGLDQRVALTSLHRQQLQQVPDRPAGDRGRIAAAG